MLKEDYIISIIGKQNCDGEKDEINLNTLGSYTKRGDIRYISYKDYDESKNKDQVSIIKIDKNNTVTMHKPSTNTKLILEKGKRHICLYDVGFGQLNLGVFTKDMKNDLNDDGGVLKINYTIDINAGLASTNELIVQVSRDK